MFSLVQRLQTHLYEKLYLHLLDRDKLWYSCMKCSFILGSEFSLNMHMLDICHVSETMSKKFLTVLDQ